jgi:Uma2 family endonuclease
VARPGLPRAYFDELTQQIDRLPEGIQSGIWEPGTLRLTRANRAHRRAARMCYRALTESDAHFWIEVEPDIRLPGDLLGVPDIAGWRLGHGAPMPEDLMPGAAPDFCCKIISADTAKNYRASRLPLYARAGVRYFWIIDPLARTVEALEISRTEAVTVLVARDNDALEIPPFDRPLPLGPLWLP